MVVFVSTDKKRILKNLRLLSILKNRQDFPALKSRLIDQRAENCRNNNFARGRKFEETEFSINESVNTKKRKS